MVADKVIDNPIINSPYSPPTKYFKFDPDGITNEVLDGRRPSSYFIPVPGPRKKGQLELATELTLDEIQENKRVNEIRFRVERWRKLGFPHVTPTSRRLLEYWVDEDRDNKILFCQREAAETAIYLAEAAQKDGQAWIRNHLDETNREHNDGLSRVALKMATGSGKTVVMAMIIAWQTLNKVATPNDSRFAKRFLVVTPGITIRDRLRVLLPEDDENYYKLRDLVPPDLEGALREAKIVIRNYHAFKRREGKQGQGLSNNTKQLLTGSSSAPSPFLESWGKMVSRVCRELGGSSEIVVLNDEAHHCYRGKLDTPEEHADTEQTLKGEEKKEATARNAEARIWFRGLMAVDQKGPGVKTVYDLSATPFFLSGSGYREGTLFPWVASDFSLIDAIESGIVKIPRVPVNDDTTGPDVQYLTLYKTIQHQLPRGGRSVVQVVPGYLPEHLDAALRSLYDSYERAFHDWERSEATKDGQPHPVFIVVCNNTAVSKMVYDFIAGWERPDSAGEPTLTTGKLPLFSNVESGHEGAQWLHRQRTILIDSQQLEVGELTPEFKKIAAVEINEFKQEYERRFPGRSADDLDDAAVLREVMNTVGKKGKLGEHVRCVVSVSMLTEGWDANTVTHILGVRAFGTQLLCEQVVGRGLRRMSYAVDENGFFTPEYADVYGVPFQFIPTVGKTKDLKLKPHRRVRAEDDRRHAEITFPRLIGYRVELPDEELWPDFSSESRLVLTSDDLATVTEMAGLVGEAAQHKLDELRGTRPQTIAFEIAQRVVEQYLSDEDGHVKPWYFPQVLAITKQWLAERLDCRGNAFPGLLLIATKKDEAASRVFHHSISRQKGDRTARMLPIFRPFDRVGSTAGVEFFTTKQVYPTDPERCHVNYVVLDGPDGNTWEEKVARTLEVIPQVAAYVKNDHLGFTIPYTFHGQSKLYLPDFLVRLRDPGDGVTRTLIVEVSGGLKPKVQTEEKAHTARYRWVPAVNAHGEYGKWSYCEIIDPGKARIVIEDAIKGLYQGVGISADHADFHEEPDA